MVALTFEDPPSETTHLTADMIAKAAGLSASAVRRLCKANGLRPHFWRRFSLSNDPKFVGRHRGLAGPYIHPPVHGIVLSVDEKSQIQALDRTQPGLPIKKGRPGIMTHVYKRYGTTTLLAALNEFDGTVIGTCMQPNRHQEFIRFLKAPADRAGHIILDNHTAHKHPKVHRWLERREGFTFYFRPTSCPWLHAVKCFFAKVSKQRLKPGAFDSVAELKAAIIRILAEQNDPLKPFK